MPLTRESGRIVKLRKTLLAPLVFLIVLHGVVLFAGFFAPYDPAAQRRALPFAPPNWIHFVDRNGRFHLRPFVYERLISSEIGEVYQEDRSHSYEVEFFSSGAQYSVAAIWNARIHLFGVDEPGMISLMGTDDYGRDQFSRLLYGAQISLLAGPLAAALAISIGLMLGALAGYYGKWLDELFMAGAELFLTLPWLYLLLGARAALPLNLGPRYAFLAIVVVLGSIGWARPARLVRGVVLTAKEREYVIAARGFGASDLYLLRRHVLPQTRGLLLTQAALLIPHYILAEVTMSFLGLGVNEPGTSWGSMLASLQQYHVLVSYWWMSLPALFLLPVIGSYYALSNALASAELGNA
jgi:peptide/nickel transport system permease protein